MTEAVYLCGLRQNAQDRSNVAIQNMGAPEEGAITLRTTVYSGEAADATARVLKRREADDRASSTSSIKCWMCWAVAPTAT